MSSVGLCTMCDMVLAKGGRVKCGSLEEADKPAYEGGPGIWIVKGKCQFVPMLYNGIRIYVQLQSLLCPFCALGEE